MAIVVSNSVADELRRSATESAVHSVEAIVRGYVDPELDETSLDLDAPRDPAIDAQLERLAQSGEIRRINLWSRDGRIVYSNVPELRGRRFSISPLIASAYAGDGVARYVDAEETSGAAVPAPATACRSWPATISSCPSRSAATWTAIRSVSTTSTRTPASSTSGSTRRARACSWWPWSRRALLVTMIWLALGGASRVLAAPEPPAPGAGHDRRAAAGGPPAQRGALPIAGPERVGRRRGPRRGRAHPL